MFSSMVDTWSVAVFLSLAVMVVALFSEGRSRHVARLLFGLRSRSTLEEVLADAPRPQGDWDLVAEVDSLPDRPAPGERAAEWATDTASKVTKVVVERASALSEPRDQAEAPRTGELSLAQR